MPKVFKCFPIKIGTSYARCNLCSVSGSFGCLFVPSLVDFCVLPRGRKRIFPLHFPQHLSKLSKNPGCRCNRNKKYRPPNPPETNSGQALKGEFPSVPSLVDFCVLPRGRKRTFPLHFPQHLSKQSKNPDCRYNHNKKYRPPNPPETNSGQALKGEFPSVSSQQYCVWHIF